MCLQRTLLVTSEMFSSRSVCTPPSPRVSKLSSGCLGSSSIKVSSRASMRKLWSVKTATTSVIALVTSSVAHFNGLLRILNRPLHMPKAFSTQYRAEASFRLSCFVIEHRSHSVVLYVVTTLGVFEYAESARIKAGTSSFLVSPSSFMVAIGNDGRGLSSVSIFRCKLEFAHTRPSATEPGQLTVKSINRFLWSTAAAIH